MAKKAAPSKAELSADLATRKKEYGKVLKLREGALAQAKEHMDNDNYLKAAEIYGKLDYKQGIVECINGLKKEGKYLAAGQLIGYLSPKQAKGYIKTLGSVENGRYIREAGMLAAQMGYEPIAEHYAELCKKQRKKKAVSDIYAILDQADNPAPAKQEEEQREYAQAA